MTTQEKLISIYEQAEKRLKEIIAAKTSKGSTAAYQRSLLSQVQTELRKLRRSSAAAVNKLVNENYVSALDEFIAELKAAGIPVTITDSDPAQLAMSKLNKSQISIIAENTNYDFNRAINLVGRRIEDSIREAAIEATGEKLTTGQTVRQMQKNLLEKLSRQDITAVPYKNGVQMPLRKYADMAARSTTAETQNTAKVTQGNKWGYDLVQMTTHSPTCAVCSMYQGRVYATTREAANGKYKFRDGTVLRFPYLYDTAFASSYNTIHPNCRHRISLFAIRAYTNEELRHYASISNAPFEDTRSDEERKAYAKDQAEKRRKNAAYKQYERIKAALPDTAPKSFAGFVRMKQTNSENYQNLMRDFRYVSRIANEQNGGIIESRKLTKLNENGNVVNPMDK